VKFFLVWAGVHILTCRFYSRVQRVAGILYLHKILDNRITAPSASIMAALGGFGGEGVSSSRILLMTTMWDNVRPEVGAVREREIMTRYWSNMLSSGSSIIRFETAKDVWTAVDSIIRSL
jgi:hypothetical protein